MNTKALERLLIDRELGELSPDVNGLLNAYLALSPEHADIAQSVHATIAVARRALGPEPTQAPDAMPPLPTQSLMRRLQPKPRLRWSWHRHLAVAAGIALAFFLGSRSVPQQEPPTPTRPPMSELAITRPNPGKFWSFERLREAYSCRQTGSAQRIEWTTPLSQPRIGERT